MTEIVTNTEKNIKIFYILTQKYFQNIKNMFTIIIILGWSSGQLFEGTGELLKKNKNIKNKIEKWIQELLESFCVYRSLWTLLFQVSFHWKMSISISQRYLL